MKLKQLIREEIIKFIKEEEKTSDSGVDSTTNLTSIIKDLGDIDVAKFNMTFNLLKQKKTLNNAANKVLADTFISLMKNADDALMNKLKQAFKKIN